MIFHRFGAEVLQCESGLCDTGGLPAVNTSNSQLQLILQIVFGIVGALALVYIIMAGLKMITSLGNPEALAKARQTLIFAAVGLFVALSAEAIVGLVIKKL